MQATKLTQMLDAMMTTAQFADRLGDGTQVETISKYCSTGRIKAIRIGRTWLISEQEFQRFVRDRRPKGRPAT